MTIKVQSVCSSQDFSTSVSNLLKPCGDAEFEVAITDKEDSKRLNQSNADVYIYEISNKTAEFDLVITQLENEPFNKPFIFILSKLSDLSEIDIPNNLVYDVIVKANLNQELLYTTVQHVYEKHLVQFEKFKSNQLYKALFYESPNPHCIVSKQFKVIKKNKAFDQLFKVEDAENVDFAERFIEDSVLTSFKQEMIEKGAVYDFEADLTTEKNELSCILNGSCLYYPDGSIEAFNIVLLNQTFKKEKQLAEKYTMTGRIARMIAHEVRNPLTNIKLALSQIQSVESENTSLNTYTGIIKRNADRINDLISSLLNASIPAEVSKSSVKWIDIIESAIDDVKDRMQLKSIKVIVKEDQQLGMQNLDENRIKIALTNLLVNASEAIEHDKGEITVTLGRDEEGNNKVSISDNGKGMSTEIRKNLFEPFYSNKRSGTGLGLSTTLNIIKAHDGKLLCQSKPEQGTTFTIVI